MKYARTDKDIPAINVRDTALIFEGGGMRASYTAGVVGALIESDINFSKVYGISAGSSHCANYLSRDVPRAYHSFTRHVVDPRAVDKMGVVNGRGYFNSKYLYEGVALELDGTDKPMAFDFEMFTKNPAQMHIEAFNRETGETVSFEKEDMPTMLEMMLAVRASSTMPLFMPPTEFNGNIYMDGGLGSSWGICIDAAKRDGFDKFFIVRTQPHEYRKKPLDAVSRTLFRLVFRRYPLVAQRTIERWREYNRVCDEIEELEKTGAAYVFYPSSMEVENKTTDISKLTASLNAGIDQAASEIDKWRTWLSL
ncbi:patatin family protein [Adlercreutzia sp. ZJ154]|uniref:patatin-like phospholipase family protein n=1 Tax=Adlercreutzia sp. ZJ154 TaxID=2709790 RepID=UPI0013EDB30B|nr:patatin family protein [Adlercreutzia sp. ZJ154]